MKEMFQIPRIEAELEKLCDLLYQNIIPNSGEFKKNFFDLFAEISCLNSAIA